MNLRRTKAAAAAVVLVCAGAIGVVTAAPADALPGKVCMTHQQFFDALSTAEQHHLYRKGRLSYGVSDVRCAHGWAVASVEAEKHGKPADSFTANEHRTAHGVWHQVDRVKPCKEHKIPKKIYTDFCESN